MYKIVFETSTDRYSYDRKQVVVEDHRLGAKIISLQAKGYVIFEVQKS
jgi:hypothetical protein